VVLCHRLLGIGPNPSSKDVELIAFRVGEYHPRRVTLPDIGPPSTEGKETFDFCGLIDRTEVRMESVLACLLLRNRHEQQARHTIRPRPDLELVRRVAHDNPAQGLGPPSTKRDRIVSVDEDLLPNEIHVAHSARSIPQADPLAGSPGEKLMWAPASVIAGEWWDTHAYQPEQQDLTAQRNGLQALGVGDDRIYVDHSLTGTNRDR